MTPVNTVSWNCHGFNVHKQDVKSIVNKYQPVCLGLQETYLLSHTSAELKNFTIQREEHVEGSRLSGGVASLTSCHILAKTIDLNTDLQAVAIQIQLNVRLTVCFLYLLLREYVGT
ncbi:hypothetical protein AVEN_101897-1 [Araneus ventricosus]|uniref:Endonuclease/exonuclease/phosphatase domain-containing protein n=1 Tax=Araneus ventricosus TaxID=182803 RepID=A0A4Y2DAI5_ARAVE|nr:hypothetical protein AVEN_240644-1 [Araneus ventricosus]GBM13038.1 hypothetical protein AVEN_101897-1 [Araneus ventricosus]